VAGRISRMGWLMGPVQIVVHMLVGVTLAYIEEPDAGGEEGGVGLLESQVIVK
jgi:hypothetical protein